MEEKSAAKRKTPTKGNEAKQPEDKYLISIICGSECMIGFLLCGFAQCLDHKSNFLVTDESMTL